MEILDDVPFDEAKAKVESGEYALIVDRALATQAFKNSDSALINLAFIPIPAFLVAVVMLLFDWRFSVAFVILGFAAFKLLRASSIDWVRKNTFSERGIYDVFSKHRIIWFTPTQP